MVEKIEKIKKIIAKAKNMAIFPSPDLRGDSFPASLALFYSLKDLGKNVNLLIEKFPEKFAFLKRKEEQLPLPGDFLISVKEGKAKISQLFYEKGKDSLNIYLKTKEGLEPGDISFQNLHSADTLITLGLTDLKVLKELFPKKPSPLINIDNQPGRKDFADLNLVEPTAATFSEVVFDVLISINENLLTREVSQALLSGIVQETGNLQKPHLTSQSLEKVGFLMEKGADLAKISSQLFGEITESALKLFGQVLSKITVAQDKNLNWAILSKADFAKTASRPSALVFSLEKLTLGLLPQKDFLLLWESQNSQPLTRGVFYSQNQTKLTRILESFEGAQKGKGVLFLAKELDPQKVKEKILKII